jgi:hypothetical protein
MLIIEFLSKTSASSFTFGYWETLSCLLMKALNLSFTLEKLSFDFD